MRQRTVSDTARTARCPKNGTHDARSDQPFGANLADAPEPRWPVPDSAREVVGEHPPDEVAPDAAVRENQEGDDAGFAHRRAPIDYAWTKRSSGAGLLRDGLATCQGEVFTQVAPGRSNRRRSPSPRPRRTSPSWSWATGDGDHDPVLHPRACRERLRQHTCPRPRAERRSLRSRGRTGTR